MDDQTIQLIRKKSEMMEHVLQNHKWLHWISLNQQKANKKSHNYLWYVPERQEEHKVSTTSKTEGTETVEDTWIFQCASPSAMKYIMYMGVKSK